MYHVTAFYFFVRLNQEQVQDLQLQLNNFAKKNNLDGLIILGNEGINATVSGTLETIEIFKDFLRQQKFFTGITFKDSTSHKCPFRRFKIRLRDEIVTINDTQLFPQGLNGHLSPQEWNHVIETENDYVLLDTRNIYETKVGIFKNAIDPKLNTFGEFADFVKQSGIPKDKKILMYCTGGIRCEKASLAMQELGYNKVYQLAGGILKYIEECPNQHYQGECFVFDHRVALDQNLKPSQKYGLCPHCGNPADTRLTCRHCGTYATVCETCVSDSNLNSCSKNCSYHLNLKSKKQVA